MEKYQKLLNYQDEITKLQCTANILAWELRLSAPKLAKNYIIDIKAGIELNIFKLKTAKEYEEILLGCINSSYFNEISMPEQNYIKKLLKGYYSDTKVPTDFYNEYKKQCSITNMIWEEAKATNNYELFKPDLQKLIEMTKQYYSYIDSDNDLYDVMLDSYEPGMTSGIIDELFDELKESIIPLIQKQKITKGHKCSFNCSEDELIECAKYLLNYIGFDLNRGALGLYTHAFTEKMSPNDIRIAFRKNNDLADFVTTITHEGGHGVFEQNVSPNLSKYRNTCMENVYALHESQSRFYENILSRNINFWLPIYDDIKKILKLNFSIEDFVKCLNIVKPNPIRVESDELTYCLHIIIRYEIEREIFKGNITVAELPVIWNQKMKDYLGLEVTSDKEGVLQDIHWAEGYYGYFPSYLLGTIYDGMFLEYVEENLGSIDELLREGKIKQITEFLAKNIYINGEAYNSKEIFEKICCKKLTVKPIIRYFKNKYDN